MIGRIKTLFNSLIAQRVIQHTLFWGLSFLILVNVLKVSAEIKTIDLIYTAIFHIPIVIIVYLNLKVLFPFLVEREKYFLYGFCVVGLTILGSGFYLILFDSWIDYLFSGYYFIAYYGFLDISLYFAVYIFISSLLRFARGYFQLQETEKEKTISELKALKSQINPHFLFNSLNSIYSLSRKQSVLVPEKIVQLSDLMRHIIYESDSDFSPLKKEVEMIKNYIDLQNLRTNERDKIKLEVKGEISNKKIAPLLLLPFVENSFKHGLKGDTKDVFVDIRIEVVGKILNFEIENNKGKKVEINNSKYKGIGIENVKKRLELIYENSHSLKILDRAEIFKVLLQLHLR